METYYQTDFVDVKIDQELKTVHIIWKGKTTVSREYRATLERALDAIEKYKLNGWLSDMTNEKLVLDMDRQWIADYLIPKALELGVSKVAFVVPKSIVVRKHADSLADTIRKHEDNIQTFSSMEDALKFLKTA
jgi:hypothetical protein